jgi:hypothetical protein
VGDAPVTDDEFAVTFCGEAVVDDVISDAGYDADLLEGADEKGAFLGSARFVHTADEIAGGVDSDAREDGLSDFVGNGRFLPEKVENEVLHEGELAYEFAQRLMVIVATVSHAR